MKNCNKCKETKETSEFYKRNKESLMSECKMCTKERSSIQKKLKNEENKKTRNEWMSKNKEKTNKYSTEWNKNNRDIMNISAKKYRDKNREKINEYKRTKGKELINNNPLLVMKRRLRNRTSSAFRKQRWNKKGTCDLLGASYEKVFNRIESLFVEGMSWDNRELWHIDHIIPLDSATNEEQLINLCHYTNLQPLWAEDNLRKSNKISKKNFL